MKTYRDLDDEPGGVELDACDELDINRAVADLAETLAHGAVRRPPDARTLLRQVRENDDDEGDLAYRALEEIVCAFGHRWPAAVSSADVDGDVAYFRGVVTRALNDIAWHVAEGQRDALTRKHIEENT